VPKSLSETSTHEHKKTLFIRKQQVYVVKVIQKN